MFHMKTASVRDLRQDFARIRTWLEAGDEVAITMRRKTIARLIPWSQRKAVKRRMPDIDARLKKVFGAMTLTDATMKAVMDTNRGPI